VRRLRIATRRSEQALAQAGWLAAELERVTGAGVDLVHVTTTGDVRRDVPIHELGGQGVFVKEVQLAVLDGRADLAVHSAKDLPSSFGDPGLVLACVPARRDPRDGVVGVLVEGGVVATGSVRRKAQLAHLRPDLRFVGLRGNIPTRVARADAPDVDAALVAVTGAEWVGLGDRITSVFARDVMTPQVGQGALAVECRVDDAETIELVGAVEDTASRRCVDAERSFLATLGGGCDLPVGAHAVIDASGRIEVIGVIADARGLRRDTMSGDDVHVGATLATALR
jgi:hydroxymethylbilane synthase